MTLGMVGDGPGPQQERKKMIMSRINLDAVRSLAVAAFVSLYASVMLAAAMGVDNVGRLVV